MAVSEAWGVIADDDEELVVDVRGFGGGIISVVGTFSGTLTVTGKVDEDAAEGGRMLFNSLAGCTGGNTIVGSGDPVSKEYRIVTGGEFIIVRGAGWSSGSATVKVYLTDQTYMTYVNGAVSSAEEVAGLDGRAFIASTGNAAVTLANALFVTINNPSDSGVNMVLTNRLFSNNLEAGDALLEYLAYANPTAVLTQATNGGSLLVGAPASVALVKYQVASVASIIMGGTPASGEVLPVGQIRERRLRTVLRPGTGLGFSITGAGQNLLKAARLSVTFEWYEERV